MLPCLYYFNRMFSVDTFILLDGAQFTKKSLNGEAFQNYTFVKAIDGQKRKLTVPVKHDGNRYAIKDKPLADEWHIHILKELEQVYSKEPYYDWLMNKLTYNWLELTKPGTTLSQLTVKWISQISYNLGLEDAGKKLVLNSELEVPGKASEWMLNFCKHYKAETYVCGKAAYDQYLDKKAFEDAGIKIEVQNWKCPEYEQGKFPFVPNLSIVDALFRHGPHKAKEIIS